MVNIITANQPRLTSKTWLAGRAMNIEQIDGHCDLFERRLKQGDRISARHFVDENRLPPDAQLVEELQKLEREYGQAHADPRKLPEPIPAVDIRPTHVMSGDAGKTVIGNYRLLQKIGEGGMGVVYMAEQTLPVSRRVAVKIVKPGMGSSEVLARFEAERQALALMDHPNIARVLDAGTTDQGSPYFVMELVKGVPITNYCDDRHLSLTERLELFLPVCHAIQHAHQKGIIHRDIKPTNILVAQYDNRPIPKIIDFGLAKAIGQKLTEKTIFTQYGQIVGTIDYMSPEQASFNQLDVDTRSDIYSLGVVLYELLSGETPFDGKRLRSATFDELLRIIRLEEPPRPSRRLSTNASLPSIAENRAIEPRKLSLLVRGELDWIVMRAIDKERDERYQSASGLADDIRRYLDHDTVLACPPSAAYRFRKFARRNRFMLASAATVVAALLLGLAATTWALVAANDAKAHAEDELRKREFENRRMQQTALKQKFQSDRFTLFADATSTLLDRLNARISSDVRMQVPELRPLRHELLSAVSDFWGQMCAEEVDSAGKPGFRAEVYRLQRAVALVRQGDHKSAFAEMRSLKAQGERTMFLMRDLARLCALCAVAASDDPGLSDLYIEDGIDCLKVAAERGATAAPARDDPDLKPLNSHKDFQAILDNWSAVRDAAESRRAN